MKKRFHSGFVAVLGRPNVGKSTFVNQLVRQKVAIVTSKPQTTRNRILGIINRPHAQLVLIDTPGIHRATNVLGRQMMAEVGQAIEGIDLLAVMIDASSGLTAGDRLSFEYARQFDRPVFLLLNKIDRIAKPALLPLIQACSKEMTFAEIMPISALTGDGVELALERFVAHLPEGAAYFPKDQLTDQPERVLAGEIIREKVMTNTEQEVPHAVAVRVDTFEEGRRLIRIRASIFVERQGQKGILIGRRGERMKAIGTAAREELEQILGVQIFLELRVKVQRDWRQNARIIQQLDWRSQLERLGTHD
ncbi:MAG TPA: GTPase Era [Candidatus Acidoferrales bacterium]|jgi:GTP-binding protein Era|nr:GTPase Era [Candidatus Acidoferrales bacterium]